MKWSTRFKVGDTYVLSNFVAAHLKGSKVFIDNFDEVGVTSQTAVIREIEVSNLIHHRARLSKADTSPRMFPEIKITAYVSENFGRSVRPQVEVIEVEETFFEDSLSPEDLTRNLFRALLEQMSERTASKFCDSAKNPETGKVRPSLVDQWINEFNYTTRDGDIDPIDLNPTVTFRGRTFEFEKRVAEICKYSSPRKVELIVEEADGTVRKTVPIVRGHTKVTFTTKEGTTIEETAFCSVKDEFDIGIGIEVATGQALKKLISSKQEAEVEA